MGRPGVSTESSRSVGDRERLANLFDGVAADEGLSGAIRIDLDGRIATQRAFGLANRGHSVSATVDTQFAIASGAKGLTALTVMSLVESGELGLNTTARSVLGADLPLIDDRVTVEQLLAHRSGIGDYLDEDEVSDWNDYVLTVPVHELATTEGFLAVLDGHPMKYAPGKQFSYCNGGYVVLALLAERASGVSFHDLVEQRVCRPAGMADTSFLRSDELPGRAAVGYLDEQGLRTNVLHLPVRGNGDGGIYTTAADVHALWDALFAGSGVTPRVRCRRRVRLGLRSSSPIPLHGYVQHEPWGMASQSTRRSTARNTDVMIDSATDGSHAADAQDVPRTVLRHRRALGFPCRLPPSSDAVRWRHVGASQRCVGAWSIRGF